MADGAGFKQIIVRRALFRYAARDVGSDLAAGGASANADVDGALDTDAGTPIGFFLWHHRRTGESPGREDFHALGEIIPAKVGVDPTRNVARFPITPLRRNYPAELVFHYNFKISRNRKIVSAEVILGLRNPISIGRRYSGMSSFVRKSEVATRWNQTAVL